MIVYFWEKSKTEYTKWGIMSFTVLLCTYMCFVWTKVLLRESDTIQIIRGESAKSTNVSTEKGSNGSNLLLVQNQYVASKKGKYFYPSNCPKAQALSVKNMLYYKDKMSATLAGYIEYLGCK